MRIALVSREYPPFYGGGIGTYARQIAPALAAAGCEVHVVTQTHDESHPRCAVSRGVHVHRAPFHGQAVGWAQGALRFSVLAARVVLRLAERGAIDAVEFAECEAAGAATGLARAMGLPGVPGVVVHMHSPTELLFALKSYKEARLDAGFATLIAAERLGIQHADRICAPSQYHADWCERHFALERPPTVIPLAYDAPAAPPPLPTREPREVMYLGRIEPRKGVEVLVRAWARIAPQRPGWRLRLVGADTTTGSGGASFRGTLRERIGGGGGTIDFVDATPPSQLFEQFARTSICVVPSLWENFPFTCVEAMSHARPVIASDEGGMKEMISSTPAGVVFRAGDEAALADALLSMTAEPVESLARRGAAGRARILSMCDAASIARRRIALYEEAAVASRERGSRRAALGFWRRTQGALSGRLDAIGLPEIKPRVAAWLPQEAVA